MSVCPRLRLPLTGSIVACALGLVAVAPARAAVAPRQPPRHWHGIPVRPLDAPPSRADARSAAAGGGPPKRHRDRVLSDERRFSRSAYSLRRAVIRAAPRRTARKVARMHLYTEDGFPEVYLALRTHWDAHGRQWVKVRVPMRPNGRTGWVPREALGRLRFTRLVIVVDRRRLRVALHRNGHEVWSAPVGVGGPGTPTPAGRFWIRERFKILDARSGYYPYAFGTADYSTLSDWPGGGVVGIHGPYHAAESIPGRISHGCIRLRVADDAWLARHIRVGVPLRVR